MTATPPLWFDPARVILSVDVSAMLARGVHPLQQVQESLESAAPGDIVELRSAFEPAPLLQFFRDRRMEVWCGEEAGSFHTCIRKPG